jgi:hypothetical protein
MKEELVEVMAADRALFQKLYVNNPDDTAAIRTIEAGLWDDDWRMAEIARHRIAALRAIELYEEGFGK